MATCSFPFGSQSCKMAFVHQRACGPFSPPEHKGKKKKKRKKRKEKKKVSKANALPKWDLALAASASAIAAGMLRKRAWPTELAAGGLV